MNERERRALDSNSQNRATSSIARYEEYLYGGSSGTERGFENSNRSYEEQRAIDEELYYKDDEDELDEQEYYLAQNSLASVPDAGWGEIANTENLEETTEAEAEVAQEVLAGALQGDFNDDPTFWSDVGQIVTGLIPIAGQLGDARDLIHALDDITNQEGYKKISSWAGLVLIVIGFVPGVGDAIAKIGKRGIKYLDQWKIVKRIGEILDEAVLKKLKSTANSIVTPLIGRIKDAIGRKLIEAEEIAQQLGEGADNLIDDVTGRPPLATEGAGNVPTRMENNPPVRGNEPMQMQGGSGNFSFPTPKSVLENLSNRNKKHLKRHLAEFQELDPTITAESLRELGASIVKPEYLTSSPNAEQLHFDKVIDINGTPTKVRAVLNRERKLRSVQIRYK